MKPWISVVSFVYLMVCAVGLLLYISYTGEVPPFSYKALILPGVAGLVLGAVCDKWC